MSKRMKNFLFQNPIQLLIHGQWWSILSTHLLQLEQWWHRSGLNILHIRQYLLLLFSGSPKWKPQNVGTCPGSVVIDWMNDHTSRMNSTWNTDNSNITFQSSVKKDNFSIYKSLTYLQPSVTKLRRRMHNILVLLASKLVQQTCCLRLLLDAREVCEAYYCNLDMESSRNGVKDCLCPFSCCNQNY